MARPRRSSVELQRLILSTAEDAFARDGYVRVTMKEVAREAGVTESVLYRHFPSRAALFREAVMLPLMNVLGSFSDASARYLEHPLDDRAMTRLVMGALLDQLTDHRAALRSFAAAEEELDPEAREEFYRAMADVLNRMGELAQAEGERRHSPSGGLGQRMTPRLAVAMILSLVVHDAWLLPRGDERPDRTQLLDHITEFMLHGIAADSTPPSDDR